MRKIEQLEQIKTVQYLTILKNQDKIVEFFSVPNGGSRNKIEASNLKKEGVRSGVSDLVIILKSKVLFLEMKAPPKILKSGKKSYTNSKVSENQRFFLNTIKCSDVCIGDIAYGFNEAKEKIDFCLKNFGE